MRGAILAACWLLGDIAAPLAMAAEPIRLEAVTIDPMVGQVCYAVVPADVNGDGKLDIVAVSENRVQWYENPAWTKHVILEDQVERDHVCLAAHDINGDGRLDFALGAGWTKLGTLYWLEQPAASGSLWKPHRIGQEGWLHRMSFADVLGTGQKQLIISPLNKTVEPSGVRLTAFEIPTDPTKQPWKPVVLDASLDRMHNHLHVDWDGDQRVDTLTASQQGVTWIKPDGRGFVPVSLAKGATSEKPEQQGSGELKVGRLRSGGRFLATVEPMHGTMVAVYTQQTGTGEWVRHEIESNLKQGHAIWAANLDDDPEDELVVGHRERGTGNQPGPGLSIYDCADEQGAEWSKQVVDHTGIAPEDAFAADFDGDGKLDLVAGGRATHNVKLYWNRGRSQGR